MTAKEVEKMAKDALRRCGIDDDDAAFLPQNMSGDDDPRCEGYVQLEGGIDICPSLVGNQIGWGVYFTAWTPGCRTLPNGDPGDPDNWDLVEVLAPSVESRGIAGPVVRPTSAAEAVRCAVRVLVDCRMHDWEYELSE